MRVLIPDLRYHELHLPDPSRVDYQITITLVPRGAAVNMTTAIPQPRIPINTINVTEKAAGKVREFAQKDGKEHFGLKVAVQGGGCSGLQYVLKLVDGPEEADKIIAQNGIEVYVPKRAFVFLAGTVLDFSDGLNGRGFEFQNPNAKRTCGCGDSFSV